MSSRRNAYLYNPSNYDYTNSPVASNSLSPGLLAKLFGQDAVSGGGINVDPTTGAISATPYVGSSGIFGGASRQQALLLNAAQKQQEANIAAQMAGIKLETGSNERIQAGVNKTNLDVESTRGANRVKEVEATGNQNRLGAQNDQVLKILSSLGQAYSPQAVENAANVYNPQMQYLSSLSNANKAMMAQDPDIQAAEKEGQISSLKAPTFQNLKTATTLVPEGSMGLIPSFGGLNYDIARGSTQDQSVVTDPLTGQLKPIIHNNPGSFVPSIDPSIKSRMPQMPTVNPYPNNNPFAGQVSTEQAPAHEEGASMLKDREGNMISTTPGLTSTGNPFKDLQGTPLLDFIIKMQNAFSSGGRMMGTGFSQ